ncbi:hypothetical protein Ais01nite_31540 [Asanoa ishikariensis]|uniref:Uncharacterized protein n=2 Tax=Asanoa TaxID=195964 RepID=A0A239PG50_9ACTN|nr:MULTISPECIES: hypothetical protein [Asanoa]GIF65119.1 hypothetical protein Ais01nite_31540 [Asanoa ishikariensis]SDZ66317.1 hypothetical protein SAMN05421684_8153 [Asanoa ishikariensis]SNT66106.1 hypothetical protein SAMN05421812_13234 [Asanoa hainanensis]
MTESPEFAALDAQSTEELRERAFHVARERLDVRFFWSVLRHLPDAQPAAGLEPDLSATGGYIDEAVALFREAEGHDFGEQEPLLRAKFIDYLLKHDK